MNVTDHIPAPIGYLEDHLATVDGMPRPPDQASTDEAVDELGGRGPADAQLLRQDAGVPRTSQGERGERPVLRGADLAAFSELGQTLRHQTKQVPRHGGHRLEQVFLCAGQRNSLRNMGLPKRVPKDTISKGNYLLCGRGSARGATQAGEEHRVRTDRGRVAVEHALPQPPIQSAPVPLEQPRAPRRFKTWEPLAHRDFALFWSGALISNIGTWLQNVALSWLIWEITHSAFWVSMVTFAQFSPTLLFGLFGGLVADRRDRRLVLLVTQTTAMGLAFALAAVTLTGHASVSTLLPIIGAAGIAMAFNAPSFQAIIPDLVPQRLIIDAVSLNSAQFSAARVVGPALGGLILATAGAGWGFFANGASFLAVILALLLIRTEKQAPPTSTGARALFGGVRSARQTPAIATLLGITAIVSLFGAPVIALLPVMAGGVLGLGAKGFGGLFALFSIGAVFGALATGTIVRRFGMRASTGAGLGLLALLIAGFGLSRTLAVSGVLLVGIGALYTMSVSATSTGLQMTVPNGKRGRVMSLYMMAWGGLYPIGAVIAGLVATRLGAPSTLKLLAVPLAVAAASLAIFGRGLSRIAPPRAAT